MDARDNLARLHVQEETLARQREEREKKAMHERVGEALTDALFAKMDKGEPMTWTQGELQVVQKKFGKDAVETALSMTSKLTEFGAQEDRRSIMDLDSAALEGALSEGALALAIENGTIRSPETARRLKKTIVEQKQSSTLNDPTVKDIIVGSGNMAGGLDELGMLKNPAYREQTMRDLRSETVRWEKENPNGSKADLYNHLQSKALDMIRFRNPDAAILKENAYGSATPRQDGGSGTSTPATDQPQKVPPKAPQPAPKKAEAGPAKPPLTTVAPSKDVDPFQVPVFATTAELDAAIQRFTSEPKDGPFNAWVSVGIARGQITKKDDITTLVERQRALIISHGSK